MTCFAENPAHEPPGPEPFNEKPGSEADGAAPSVSEGRNHPDPASPAPGLTRYRMTLAYDGTEFHGWQEQTPPETAPLRTVQAVVKDALVQTFRQPIVLTGASRTDTGVHARGQVAHFDASTRIPLDRIALAINSRLPEDVEVLDVKPADPQFNAIADATDKQYRYRIWTSFHKPLGLRHQVYQFWRPLDEAKMAEGAARLVGEHDMVGLTNSHHGRLNTVRRIHDCRVARLGDEIHITISSNGFLFNMVRIVAGTLLEIGRGRMPVDRIDEIYRTGNRRLAGPTLPPQALCLEWIRYGKWDEP